ncbi:MAG TPA: methylenetetrahydrofolate reductase, partial [Roseiflexaceae bacterium]|nr:methylenetetrahydrofolate reductase [Roseiflexaceae bacterium]
MERADDGEQAGIELAARLTNEVLSIEGVRGVHLMTVGWTRAIPQVVERAGLLPRPPLPPET